jgi:signal transduction histidine kinase
MLRQLFPPSVRIEITAMDTALPVQLDRSEFELMILNIAANARDAMPDGGVFSGAVSPAARERVEIGSSSRSSAPRTPATAPAWVCRLQDGS